MKKTLLALALAAFALQFGTAPALAEEIKLQTNHLAIQMNIATDTSRTCAGDCITFAEGPYEYPKSGVMLIDLAGDGFATLEYADGTKPGKLSFYDNEHRAEYAPKKPAIRIKLGHSPMQFRFFDTVYTIAWQKKS